jgi:hypothetical protein
MRTWTRPWITVAIILSGVFLIGITVAVLFDWFSTTKDDLWSVVSRAGVGIAATTVAGAVATGAYKLVDEHRGRDQERRRVFHEVVEAYNEFKATRRSLKSLGLLSPRSGQLQAEEAKELRLVMARLNDAQLKFEAIAREVAESDLFNRRESITGELRAVEDYINKSVLDLWERNGGRVWSGADVGVIETLALRDFDRNFKQQVRTPLDRLTQILHQELFGTRR